MSNISNFTDLIAYKKAHELVIEVYKITKKFPEDEKFGLTNQIRRAGISITSNIAEGFARMTAKDKAHFYGIALLNLLMIPGFYYYLLPDDNSDDSFIEKPKSSIYNLGSYLIILSF